MMRFLLDTNVWIDALRRSNANILERMRVTRADNIVLSSIVLGELGLVRVSQRRFVGPMLSSNSSRRTR
ncbi:PIN domain-containing protein [Corynebacterium coyleae]